MHEKRRYRVVDVADAEALAKRLKELTWCSCDAFRVGGLVFANDSTSPDGAQEYAVVCEETGAQVESLTVSWMSEGELRDAVEALLTGTRPVEVRQPDGCVVVTTSLAGLASALGVHVEPTFGFVNLHTDHPEGSCAGCA